MSLNTLKYHLIIHGVLFILLTTALQAQKPAGNPVIPESFCISANELILANTINDYRNQNNLPPIPLSRSLFFVARMHVLDLSQNHPDKNNCNQHSWSDKGNWKPCCYGKESGKTNCMTDKPKEITGFTGKGYEIIYWDSEEVIPVDALELWKSLPLTNEMLLNQGKWKTKVWKSFGVGILDGNASVWFGDAIDHLQGIRLCDNDSIVVQPPANRVRTDIKTQKDIQPKTEHDQETITNPNVEAHFHLIIGSFRTGTQAAAEVEKLRGKGYREAKILGKDTIFRISIAEYGSMSEAEKAMRKLTTTFKGIWIYKY